MKTPLAAAAAALILVPLSLGTASAAAPAVGGEKGEYWQMTTRGTFGGMTMPATTVKFCKPKGDWKEPPGSEKNNCKVTSFAPLPNRMTWSMVCTDPKATANGEILFKGPDAFSGTLNMTMEQGTMSMQMDGKRLGGACDVDEQRRTFEKRAAQAQAQSGAAMEQGCAEGARNGSATMFVGETAMCSSPAQKKAFCAGFGTPAGFAGVKQLDALEGMPGTKQSAAFCGGTVEQFHKQACAAGANGDAEGLNFVAAECPAEAQAIAQRECAGRRYTALAGSKYQSFCGQYARSEMRGGAQAQPRQQPQQPQQQPETTKDKAKKVLKGIFGR